MPFWSPACPFTLACFYAPIPPAPFPSGEGGDSKYISPGATAPGTPAIGWDAALDLLLENGTFSLSGKSFPQRARIQMRQEMPPPLEIIPAGSASAARVQPRGCKGRSPLHKITFSLPLPAGKGVGGMGAKIFFHPKNPAGRSSQCRTGTSRIQNPQQKRLSRFCKTQNPSHHPTQQGNRRSGRQRKSSAK